MGVVSIKSKLDKAQLIDAIEGIALIPPTEPLAGKNSPILPIPNYEDWPLKIVYANDGISVDTLYEHLYKYYEDHPEIPSTRMPNIIHVAGKYVIFRITEEMLMNDTINKTTTKFPIGSFWAATHNPDLQAIVWVLKSLQEKATASAHIFYKYDELLNNLQKI